MYELKISSSANDYSVSIGTDVFQVIDDFDAVVSDSYFRELLNGYANVIFVDASEANKNLSQVEVICERFKRNSVRRGSRILAIGGGVIQDLVTMAASIYMRGVDWVYAPTTMTGMMDSCLGGKSSINVGKMKNLVGNVYPPRAVIVDTSFAKSLDQQSLISGLAEGVKICFARSADAFSGFISDPAALKLSENSVTPELINLTLSSKKWFIEVDEFDRKERQLLNFGHSFGHAFEAASGFAVQHGVAVALGMLAACKHPVAARTESADALVSYSTALCQPVLEEIRDALRSTNWNTFADALSSDKKNTPDSLVLILPDEEQQLKRVELRYDEDSVVVAERTMQNALIELTTK